MEAGPTAVNATAPAHVLTAWAPFTTRTRCSKARSTNAATADIGFSLNLDQAREIADSVSKANVLTVRFNVGAGMIPLRHTPGARAIAPVPYTR